MTRYSNSRVGFVSLFVLLIAGCSSGIRPPDEYTGCATDEHWHSFDDVESRHQVVADDSHGPALTNPTSGETVSPAPLPRFTWTPQPLDPGAPTGTVVYMNGPGCDNCCPEFNLGALTSAHLPEISGDVYDLQFFVGGTTVHRVLSSLQEWSPHQDLWTRWSGQTVQLGIVRMALVRNGLRGMPYTETQRFSFTVQ